MMKKNIFCLMFIQLLIFHFVIVLPPNLNTYYIYLKPGDRLLNKTSYENTINIAYNCSCYARKYNLEFRSNDTSKNFIKRKLPTQYYTMITFAALASKEWEGFKDGHFWNDRIYIVEEIVNHKYRYQLVKFYTVEHDE